jgi:transposase InsO family protein
VGKIDDHSRFVTGHRWGWSEDSLHLAAAFKRAVAARGLPGTAYVDYADPPVMPMEHPGGCWARDALAMVSA